MQYYPLYQTALPVSLEEAKAHLRIEHDEENSLIIGQIAAAVEYFNGQTGILGDFIAQQVFCAEFDGFGCLELPFAAYSIIEVKAGDAIISSDTYRLSGRVLELVDGKNWPVLAAGERVKVVFAVGSPSSTCQPNVRFAILALVGHLWQNRSLAASGKDLSIPAYIHNLIAPHRKDLI